MFIWPLDRNSHPYWPSRMGFVTFLFFHPDGVLHGSKDGRFYKRASPTCSDDNWQGSATVIGRAGWSAFQFLFFDPQGTLYGVLNGRLYKRSPPASGDDIWIQSSAMIGKEGWDKFTHLFFMPNCELYGVKDDKLYKSPPPSDSSVIWIQDSTCIGSGGWSPFKFLISPLHRKWSTAAYFLWCYRNNRLQNLREVY